MGTTTLDVLEKRIHQDIGDWIEVLVTTAIAANNSIVSTNLNQYDHGQDDFFINWWVYITDKANAGVERQISDYATSGGTITVRGAVLTTDGANLATIRVYRYSRTDTVRAINNACRETFPSLYHPIDDRSIITGNLLPTYRWIGTATMEFYAVSNVTQARTYTAGLTRNDWTSSKLTASAGNGYLGLSSDDYPPLLDIQGKGVTLKCWAYPEVANDAWVRIYTVSNDGTTTQTLTSTTTCAAGVWTLLELEDQTINSDLSQAHVRLGVTTNTKYVYFAAPRLTGVAPYEYVLPKDLDQGRIHQVWLQSTGQSDDWCDDFRPQFGEQLFDWHVYKKAFLYDGTEYNVLRFDSRYLSLKRMNLLGSAPLTHDLSSATDTIEIDGYHINLLVAYAKYKLFQTVQGFPSALDDKTYEKKMSAALWEYRQLLPRLSMARKTSSLKLPRL